ncbi:MAG: hypothetical protein ABI867_14830 [Kofleriaceae bacterium]
MASKQKTAKKPRGAKASRSSFRAKPAAKPRPKPKAAAKKKKPAARRATIARTAARPNERVLGEITVPSGTLALLDIGLYGYLPRDALEPAIVKADVPADRPLRVVGTTVGTGRFAASWDHVAIVVSDGEIRASKKVGEVGADFGRILAIDHAALDHWVHEDSLDGLADFVFTGRDAAVLAASMNARRLADGYGWIDLPIAEADHKADEVARRKASNSWLLATELRPHSHHHRALAAARTNEYGAGALELAGTRLLDFRTTWDAGVFPIYVDRDAANQPVQIRIQLHLGTV